MKRYTHSAIILLAAITLVGCSKTDEFQHNPDSALQIESVSGISPFALTTKAVITGESLPGEEATKGIGIFVTASDGSAYDGHNKGYTNVNFANSGSGWSTATPVYLSDTEGKLYGYFPYNGTANDLKAIPVQSSLNGTDYLYAEPQTVNHSNKSVSLTMNHALSCLHLTIKKGANFTAEAPLSNIVLKSTAIDATGTMDLTDGTITPSKKSGETGIVELATDGEITTQGIEKDILIVPADNTEGKKDITLILTIGGKLASVSLSGENGINIRSGIQNNVTLTIEDTGIKVTGVDVGVWSEGGSQQVQVSAHTVTVKLSEDAGIAGNLIVQCKPDGNSVKVEVCSKTVKPLVIRIGTDTRVAPVENGNISTFTISDVTSDITATLAYAKIFRVTGSIVPDVTPAGGYLDNIEFSGIGNNIPEGRTVTVKVSKTVPGYHTKMVCDGRTVTGDAIVLEDITKDLEVSAHYEFYDYPLPGVFTVADDDRKVKFARGNMWCQNNVLHNEDEQYQFSSESWRDGGHISHFMWSKSLTESVKQTYEDSGASPGDTFFTNAEDNQLSPNPDLIVNGQKGIWRVLSGGENGEWNYLLNSRATTYGKGTDVENRRYAAVKVNDMPGLLVFPDEFSWPTAAGTEPATFNAAESDWNGVNYQDAAFLTLQAAGCVFLPAAGYRYGYGGNTVVSDVGSSGYYWSSTPNGLNGAYHLDFFSGFVVPASGIDLLSASAVRLVTDVK